MVVFLTKNRLADRPVRWSSAIGWQAMRRPVRNAICTVSNLKKVGAQGKSLKLVIQHYSTVTNYQCYRTLKRLNRFSKLSVFYFVKVRNGHIKRITDNDIQSLVLEIVGSNVRYRRYKLLFSIITSKSYHLY